MLHLSKKKYNIETENLAVPEIHTDAEKKNNPSEKEEHEIEYDNLAMPEIHRHHGGNSD